MPVKSINGVWFEMNESALLGLAKQLEVKSEWKYYKQINMGSGNLSESLLISRYEIQLQIIK
jgi:hypothetical protein